MISQYSVEQETVSFHFPLQNYWASSLVGGGSSKVWILNNNCWVTELNSTARALTLWMHFLKVQPARFWTQYPNTLHANLATRFIWKWFVNYLNEKANCNLFRTWYPAVKTSWNHFQTSTSESATNYIANICSWHFNFHDIQLSIQASKGQNLKGRDAKNEILNGREHQGSSFLWNAVHGLLI